MEKFSQEDIGKLYGHSIQLQAMLYFLAVGDWEKEPDAVRDSITSILRNCNGIIDTVLPKAEEFMPKAEETKADEQEKAD